MLRNSRYKYFDSICSSRGLNPKRFWSLFKFNNKTRNIPQKLSVKVTETKRTSAGNPADIAALFNNYFTSIFTTDPNIENYSPDALPYQSNNTIIEDITLSEADVFSILHNLDINKAQGPDGIPARLLKETARQIAPSLTVLFNKSLNTGVFPRNWKLANVVPVHKKDNKDHVENYRPISLLSLISKALERCVFNKIKDHVFEQINNGQHGFVSRKSCVTQLIEVFEYIGRELDLGKQVDVIYLDMSKAFDRVSHMQLLKRLRDFGFGGNILNWFRSYLKDRRQQTTVPGATSSALPVTSGVPQGSILGPLLFLLYQNNLPNFINHSKIATFADDTKIYKVINAKADASAMENDLANFQTSSANANLLLNTDKCKTLRITRKRNKIDHTYKLQDSALKTTDCERDLGVWTSSTLTWSKQVLHQCAQANKSLGYIRRSTIKIKTISVRRTLYLTPVRSHLAYASQVWAPQTVDLIKRTERVQRRASKYIISSLPLLLVLLANDVHSNPGPFHSRPSDASSLKLKFLYLNARSLKAFAPHDNSDVYSSKSDTNSPPWIDGEVQHLIRKKCTALKKYRLVKSDSRKLKLRTLSKKIKYAIRSNDSEYLAKIKASFKDNPKLFWSYHKSILHHQENQGPKIAYNGVTAKTAAARVFPRYFCHQKLMLVLM
ncbi:Hypothetical predicted protein [Paramuricea clavata]|uniref:Uncharacterized protein n=1 Tax=Paramuricea clavata TaxID=317549 RepID=A0A6S7GPR2_PARCT|nr:Hypothetical predicted protein [Paramuricea clavata]